METLWPPIKVASALSDARTCASPSALSLRHVYIGKMGLAEQCAALCADRQLLGSTWGGPYPALYRHHLLLLCPSCFLPHADQLVVHVRGIHPAVNALPPTVLELAASP